MSRLCKGENMKPLKLASLLLSLGLLFSSCDKPPVVITPTVPVGAVIGVNGLSATEREQFYHTPEGSELYPYAWAKALISAQNGKPFLENMERFGLVPDEKSEQNPY